MKSVDINYSNTTYQNSQHLKDVIEQCDNDTFMVVSTGTVVYFSMLPNFKLYAYNVERSATECILVGELYGMNVFVDPTLTYDNNTVEFYNHSNS